MQLRKLVMQTMESTQPTKTMELTDLVGSALRRRMLGSRTLRFELRDGTVVLSGLVRSYYQKQLAQESVRDIDGVEAIENQIEVVGV
jgi:osmotically-inducible protein OsmY